MKTALSRLLHWLVSSWLVFLLGTSSGWVTALFLMFHHQAEYRAFYAREERKRWLQELAYELVPMALTPSEFAAVAGSREKLKKMAEAQRLAAGHTGASERGEEPWLPTDLLEAQIARALRTNCYELYRLVTSPGYRECYEVVWQHRLPDNTMDKLLELQQEMRRRRAQRSPLLADPFGLEVELQRRLVEILGEAAFREIKPWTFLVFGVGLVGSERFERYLSDKSRSR